MTGLVRLLSLIVLVCWSEASEAHSPIPGIGAFYGGFLHPILVPAQLLLLLASNLAVGRSGLTSARFGALAVVAGLGAGLIAGSLLAVTAVSQTFLLAVALALAILVIFALVLTPPVALICGCAAGLLVGLDSTPESGLTASVLLAALGTLSGGSLLTFVVLALSLSINREWERIGVRVLGSWIAATAILVSALSFRR